MPVDQKIITSTLLRDRAKLLAYIGSIVRDPHVAEDVLQEVSMLALEKQDQIKDAEVLLPWLRVAARFKSLKAVEKNARHPKLMDSQLLDLMEPHWQAVDRLSTQETNRALQRCVEKLAPQAQRLIELRYGAGLSVRDIATQLNRKIDTLYKTFTRVHASLERCMRKANEG
ncbi:MAG: sigma-70 family RNA polymerase sigma factor [Phycisphaeraceae bacterium]